MFEQNKEKLIKYTKELPTENCREKLSKHINNALFWK